MGRSDCCGVRSSIPFNLGCGVIELRLWESGLFLFCCTSRSIIFLTTSGRRSHLLYSWLPPPSQSKMVASRKRKRKNVGGVDDDDDDDDTTCGLRQILPVASLPIDFDGEPTDGMQYLFTVRRDARRLPDIKHVDNPYTFCPSRPAQSAIQPLSGPTQNVEVPSPLPSKEWRSEFEHRFRNFRGPAIHPQRAGPLKKMIPDKKNRDAWWAFLDGAPESVWNPPRSIKQGNEHNGQRHGATHHPPSVTPLDGDATQKPRELSPTQLFQLDHLVKYFTHWFNLYLQSLDTNSNDDHSTTSAYTPTDIHMRWIFALLTRIDLFCSADDMACLRNLARACLSLISVVRRRKEGTHSPLRITSNRIEPRKRIPVGQKHTRLLQALVVTTKP
ncbi:hypothetical protein BGY98DRAFT_584873 [Russula aff. rugulosa BPL654]|nr:hypothetical protein BGY98DRAFT_584873 [Russula aff. rugulosa BPL654]